jgi:hypothetical protein
MDAGEPVASLGGRVERLVGPPGAPLDAHDLAERAVAILEDESAPARSQRRGKRVDEPYWPHQHTAHSCRNEEELNPARPSADARGAPGA